MASVDIMFSRQLLKQIMPDVRKHAPADANKDAWVWHAGRGHWEFHGPADFYWHGRAGNAYEARYKGWSAWLTKMGIE